MAYQFDILTKNRLLILKIIDGYTIDQLNQTPEGFSNNIAWNIAHLVVTQQILCYKFSGLPMLVSGKLVEKYMKGTAPKDEMTNLEFEEIKRLFIELPKQFEADYNNRIFNSYTPYTTSVDVTLTDIDSAFAFSNFHEGIHLGVILGLRKLV